MNHPGYGYGGAGAPSLPRSQPPSPPRQQNTERVYGLRDSKGRTWLNLRLKSRAWREDLMPLYWNGDTISGSVEVDLADRSETAKSISVKLQGELESTTGDDGLVFLEETTHLWPAYNDAASIASSSSTSSWLPKLSGSHVWPFVFRLPDEVTIADPALRQPPSTTSLPPTFSERQSPIFVDYKIIVVIKRGAMRVPLSLPARIMYHARSRALAPSPLRQLAYRQRIPIPGPDTDPEGWRVFAPVRMSGKLFRDHIVEVQCILAIAKPLVFAAGSPIPVMLSVTASERRATEVLCSGTAPDIRLTRYIATGEQAAVTSRPRIAANLAIDTICSAEWYSSTGGSNGTARCQLHGELSVPKGLKNDFVIPRLALWYTISFFHFNTSDFVPSVRSDEALQAQRVSIVTDNATGIAPLSYLHVHG